VRGLSAAIVWKENLRKRICTITNRLLRKKSLVNVADFHPAGALDNHIHYTLAEHPYLFSFLDDHKVSDQGAKTSLLGAADLTAQSENYAERWKRIRDSGRDDRLGLGGFKLGWTHSRAVLSRIRLADLSDINGLVGWCKGRCIV